MCFYFSSPQNLVYTWYHRTTTKIYFFVFFPYHLFLRFLFLLRIFFCSAAILSWTGFFSGFYFNRELFHSVIMCSWLVYLKEIESTFCYFLFRWVSRSLAFGFLLNKIFLRSFNLFDGKWQRQSKIFHPQMPKQDFIWAANIWNWWYSSYISTQSVKNIRGNRRHFSFDPISMHTTKPNIIDRHF